MKQLSDLPKGPPSPKGPQAQRISRPKGPPDKGEGKCEQEQGQARVRASKGNGEQGQGQKRARVSKGKQG